MFGSSIKADSDRLCSYAARALRGLGDGLAIIILPVDLQAVGFSPHKSVPSPSPCSLALARRARIRATRWQAHQGEVRVPTRESWTS